MTNIGKSEEQIMNFLGTYAELQDEVKLTGVYGEWRDLGNRKQYRSDGGAILNWWQSTGTIRVQGPGLAAEEFQAKLLSRALGDATRADLVDWFLEGLFAKFGSQIPE
jgi:hypothetical protein